MRLPGLRTKRDGRCVVLSNSHGNFFGCTRTVLTVTSGTRTRSIINTHDTKTVTTRDAIV